jgi:hypothetical protein
MGLRVPPSLRGCSIQRLEQSFDFAPNEIVNGTKFFHLFSSIDARESLPSGVGSNPAAGTTRQCEQRFFETML